MSIASFKIKNAKKYFKNIQGICGLFCGCVTFFIFCFRHLRAQNKGMHNDIVHSHLFKINQILTMNIKSRDFCLL